MHKNNLYKAASLAFNNTFHKANAYIDAINANKVQNLQQNFKQIVPRTRNFHNFAKLTPCLSRCNSRQFALLVSGPLYFYKLILTNKTF